MGGGGGGGGGVDRDIVNHYKSLAWWGVKAMSFKPYLYSLFESCYAKKRVDPKISSLVKRFERDTSKSVNVERVCSLLRELEMSEVLRELVNFEGTPDETQKILHESAAKSLLAVDKRLAMMKLGQTQKDLTAQLSRDCILLSCSDSAGAFQSLLKLLREGHSMSAQTPDFISVSVKGLLERSLGCSTLDDRMEHLVDESLCAGSGLCITMGRIESLLRLCHEFANLDPVNVREPLFSNCQKRLKDFSIPHLQRLLDGSDLPAVNGLVDSSSDSREFIKNLRLALESHMHSVSMTEEQRRDCQCRLDLAADNPDIDPYVLSRPLSGHSFDSVKTEPLFCTNHQRSYVEHLFDATIHTIASLLCSSNCCAIGQYPEITRLARFAYMETEAKPGDQIDLDVVAKSLTDYWDRLAMLQRKGYGQKLKFHKSLYNVCIRPRMSDSISPFWRCAV